MSVAQSIRQCLSEVARLRALASADAELDAAVRSVKALQSQRFAGSYADLLADPHYAPSATFFLAELYSGRDFSARDEQFGRIAAALERSFPAELGATVQRLAQLHALSETLDLALASIWLKNPSASPAARYLLAWRAVGQRAQRDWQLASVLALGRKLGALTRRPALRLLLSMMHPAARLAGLAALQQFLESGFDHFAGMARERTTLAHFLATIEQRETAWLKRFFDASDVTCETDLALTLGLAPSRPD